MTTKPQYPEQHKRLRSQLARVGWVVMGSLVERGNPGQGGPRYQWSRRVDGKTVTVALSREQFEWMQAAIQNQRTVNEIISALQKISLEHMWENLPSTSRRKCLSKKTLGVK